LKLLTFHSAFGGMTSYLIDLKLDTDVYSLGNFKVYDPNSDTITMLLDGQTLLNLEILQNNRDGEKRGSLLEFLDHCVLGFGRRLFRSWVCHPLRNAEAIRLRQEAVEALGMYNLLFLTV
jgi:DNA mismatch repair protein MSH6